MLPAKSIHAGWLGAIGVISILCFLAAPLRGQREPGIGAPPTEGYYTTTWQHQRLDEPELAQLGQGSVEAGMNLLGAKGYELFLVTSVLEDAKPGFHYFKRPPWNRPGTRPPLEYTRVDASAIAELGSGSFGDGLTALEQEGWQLIAITTYANGRVGWHYFQRQKTAISENGVR